MRSGEDRAINGNDTANHGDRDASIAWSVVITAQFEQRHANILSGFLDVLHRFASAGTGGLIPAMGFLNVIGGIIDQLFQSFVRFHGVNLSR